jgi:hypothetical protein
MSAMKSVDAGGQSRAIRTRTPSFKTSEAPGASTTAMATAAERIWAGGNGVWRRFFRRAHKLYGGNSYGCKVGLALMMEEGGGNPRHGFIDGWRPLRSASHRRIIRRELRLVVTPTTTKFRVGARREIRGGLVDCPCRIHVSGGGCWAVYRGRENGGGGSTSRCPADFVAQSPCNSSSAR